MKAMRFTEMPRSVTRTFICEDCGAVLGRFTLEGAEDVFVRFYGAPPTAEHADCPSPAQE